MVHARDRNEDRPSIVFATRDLPLPPRSGAPLRTHRLLTGLAETFAVTLLTFEHEEASPHQPMTRAAYAEALPGIDVVTVPGLGGGKRLSQLASLPRRSSWEWGRYRRPAFVAALRETVARTGAALVHFDDVGSALSGPVPGALASFAPHNVEHRIIAGTASAGTGVRRAFATLEARRVEREERRLWAQADLCVAVSNLDAEAMRAGGARRAVVVPNGTDPVPMPPPPVLAPDEPLRILFVGLGNYWPNEQGIAWMVREVLPLVRRSIDAVFDVVGEPPNDPVRGDGVTYHGRVPELGPFYERAHVVVAPLFLGSGTRLKVVEGMARGRPVVSTTVGAEGLPVRPGEHYVREDDPAAFAAALVDLAGRLGDPATHAMLGKARDAIEPLLWPRIAAGLAATYEAEIATRRTPPPPRSAR